MGVAFSSNGGATTPSLPTTTTTATTTTRRDRVVLSAVTRGTRIETNKDIELLLTRNRRVVDALAAMNNNGEKKNTDTDSNGVVSDDEVTRLRYALAFETG